MARKSAVPRSRGRQLFAQFMDGVQQAEMARRIGVSREMVRLLVDGRANPGLEVAIRIEQITLGKVPAAAWIEQAA